jgi:predicted dienelactone hydrolase
MLTQWENHASIDPDRIGIFGFSAGAATALISAGGELDLALIGPHCAASPEFVCRIMVPVDHPQPAVWTHDPRIRAAIIAAPGVGFAFEPKSLAGVRIPIQLWAGSSDDTVPYKSNTAVVRDALRGSVDFHQVPDAVHLSFLSPCTTETPPFLCADKPGFDRAAFHASFNRAVVDFLRHYLATATRPPNDHQHSDN